MLHKAMPNRERLAQAKALEAEEETGEAIKIYKSVLATDPLNEAAIGRLLVLYRRQKAYKEELALLRSAISAYEAEQVATRDAWRKQHQKAARVATCSAS